MGRSRSRSRSHSRGRRHTRSSSRSSGSSSGGSEGVRIHIGNLSVDCTKGTIEKVFEKFGPLNEVWVASYPPCFAFIVFRYREDAEEAVREMDGKVLGRNRVRCSFALPRSRGRRSRGYDPSMRCYQCGQPGHFSRECRSVVRGYRRHSKSCSNSRSRSRERSRRSRSRERRSDSHGRRSKSPKRRSTSESRRESRKRSDSGKKDTGTKDESTAVRDKERARSRRESSQDGSKRLNRDGESSRHHSNEERGLQLKHDETHSRRSEDST